MNSIQELAQWVINNRYPKNEKEKTSDLEMYQTIVNAFEELSKPKKREPCKKCDWLNLVDRTAICKVCGTHCPF